MRIFTSVTALLSICFISTIANAEVTAGALSVYSVHRPDPANSRSGSLSDSAKKNLKSVSHNLLLDMPDATELSKHALLGFNNKRVLTDSIVFKPSIKVGLVGQMYAFGEQDGYSNPQKSTSANTYNKGFNIARVRIMLGGQLSRKGSFFLETELASAIGTPLADGSKNVKVSPLILDAQYEYDFSTAFQLIAGEQLISATRNGLQSVATLMGNNYGYTTFPYNLQANSPLEGNFGRDLGVNARGFLFKERLEYRLGAFTGRNTDGRGPVRIVGRVAYNFLDIEKGYYYAGTKLGKGRTFTLGAGFDNQGTYYNFSTDLFLDEPITQAGSITVNASAQYLTGGTNTTSKYSFASLIPAQNIQFIELGYYFKKVKLQPWVRFENQNVKALPGQSGTLTPAVFNQLKSSTGNAAGLNYFFNGMGTNLRLSYNSKAFNVQQPMNTFAKKSYNQIWLQLQFFIF